MKQTQLWENSKSSSLDLKNGKISIINGFLSKSMAHNYFSKLYDSIDWQQNKIKVYDKIHKVPRMEAWYGNHTYAYSGNKMEKQSMLTELKELKERIEQETQLEFNCVLCNLYLSGSKSVGWHSDDEPELGKNPKIASISLGATRNFTLKHKFDKSLDAISIPLSHGSR